MIVIGGGAAGMMAAVAAAEAGASVTLAERNEKLGKKLYITGKGRCNVTNACPPEDFLRQVMRNPRFLFSALRALPPQALMDKLEAWGCPVMVERGGRVFPQSEKASDVTRAFERRMESLGVKVLLNTRVREIVVGDGGSFQFPVPSFQSMGANDSQGDEQYDGRCGRRDESFMPDIADGQMVTSSMLRDQRDKRRGDDSKSCRDSRVAGVLTESGQHLSAGAIVLCTGGKSYASTGSTGDGFALLEACGHTVLPAKPALIPLCSAEPWVHALQGLSLKNVRLTLSHGRKALFSDIGEMLFTHFGFSGPLILSASSYMADLSLSEVALTLDLKPGLTAEKLDDRLLRDIAESGRKQLQTLLCGLLPISLAEMLPALCGLDGRKQASALLREERAALIQTIKALALPVSGTRPLGEAVITRGGVYVREISPSTMESKRVCGLYVAGELLDMDALTGGYNLHIAFCTGYLAGMSAGAGAAR